MEDRIKMTVQNFMSEELSKYVWFDKDGNLIHSDDMPTSLENEYLEAKKKFQKIKEAKRQEKVYLLEEDD